MYVCVCSKRFFSKRKTACFLFKILVLKYLELFMCTLGTDKRIYLFLWIKSTKKMVWHDLIFVESEKILYKLIWMKCYFSIFKILHERKKTYMYIYKHKNKTKQCSQLSQRAYGFWVVHSCEEDGRKSCYWDGASVNAPGPHILALYKHLNLKEWPSKIINDGQVIKSGVLK